MPDSNFSNLEVVESPLIFGFSRIFTRAAERTPRPHPVTSFVLSAVLLISFLLIQFSGTLAFYHKTIFMVRCFFFAAVLTWCWLRDDWQQVCDINSGFPKILSTHMVINIVQRAQHSDKCMDLNIHFSNMAFLWNIFCLRRKKNSHMSNIQIRFAE